VILVHIWIFKMKWTSQILFDSQLNVTCSWDALMLSLCPGPLLGEMVQHMKDKRDGKLSPQQKAFIYSAVCNQITYKSSVNDLVNWKWNKCICLVACRRWSSDIQRHMSKLFVQDRYVVKMINWKISEFIFKKHIQLLCKRGTAVNPTQNLPVMSWIC